MKKLLPLITMFAAIAVIAAKLFLAKQYGLLCFIQAHDAGLTVPSYFTDTIITILPCLL